jgi:outer membrane protein TolC
MELRNALLITVIADVAREYFEIRGRQMQWNIVRRNVAMAQRAVDLLEARSSGHERPKSSETSGHDQQSKSSSSGREQSKSSESSGHDEKSAGHDDRSTAADRRLSKELDLASAKRELATWQAKLPEPDAAIFAAQSRLAVLLGTYSADTIEVTNRPAKMPRLPEHLRPGVPVDLLRRRPDVRAAERELAEETARIGVATADLFPSVMLTAAVGGQYAEHLAGTPPIPLHGPIWSVGPATYWPLFDFGRLDALINIQEMRAHEELVKFKKTIIAAVEEVERAISQYRLDLARLRRLGIALQESRREAELATELFERRQTEGHIMLGAQHKYYTLAEETAIATEVAVCHYVAVFKALGGGWELYNELPPIPAPQPAIIAGVRRVTNGWH